MGSLGSGKERVACFPGNRKLIARMAANGDQRTAFLHVLQPTGLLRRKNVQIGVPASETGQDSVRV